jgi:hypothetical protein
MKKNKHVFELKSLLFFAIFFLAILISSKNVLAADCNIAATKIGSNMIINASVDEAGIDCSQVYFNFFMGHSGTSNPIPGDINANGAKSTNGKSCSASQAISFSEIKSFLGADSTFNFTSEAWKKGMTKINMNKYCDDSTAPNSSSKSDLAAGAITADKNAVDNATAVTATAKDTGTITTGGLVPCGKNGQEPCTLCHLVVGIQGVIDYGRKIMTYVALLMIAVGGILYTVSAGNEKLMTQAKSLLWYVLTGFAIILGAWIIVNYSLILLSRKDNLGIEQAGSWSEFKCSTTKPAAK